MEIFVFINMYLQKLEISINVYPFFYVLKLVDTAFSSKLNNIIISTTSKRIFSINMYF